MKTEQIAFGLVLFNPQRLRGSTTYDLLHPPYPHYDDEYGLDLYCEVP